MGKVIVVDDEPTVLELFERLLADEGHIVVTAGNAETGLELVRAGDADLLITDVQLPGLSGLEALQQVRQLARPTPVIVMTGQGTMDTAIQAMQHGAFEYLVKPFDRKPMLEAIRRAMDCARLMRQPVEVCSSSPKTRAEGLIGRSPGMQEVFKAIGRVAATDTTVLVRGETGTGKELVARALYQHSRRRSASLFSINCAAIPETLLESELFGHERGAFTGAVARRIGRFEQAAGGTIFLDEIGDLPLALQPKILRLLEQRTLERVGGNETIQVDVRVIAATNRNLERAASQGKFREDLYYRLNVVTIEIPPLRERRQDIPPLIDYFLDRFCQRLEIARPHVAPEALAILSAHPWTGNVRDLRHCIERLLIATSGFPIQAEDVQHALAGPAEGSQEPQLSWDELQRQAVNRFLSGRSGSSSLSDFLESAERLMVAEGLRRTGGNQSQAAKLLGLVRQTLQAKMSKYGIRPKTVVEDDPCPSD